MPDAIDWLAICFLFALGASLGSFLNVVVFRLPATEVPTGAGTWETARRQIRGISHPPSHCPKCGYQLRWFDNFPVLGWIWLRGRCRKCKANISVQYPLIEALLGLVFAGFYACFFLLGPNWGPPTGPLVVERNVQVAVSKLEPMGLPAREVPALDEVAIPEMAITDIQELRTRISGGTATVTLAITYRALAIAARDWPVLAMTLALAWCLIAAALIDARHYYIPRALSYIPALVGLVVHTIHDRPLAPLSVMAGSVGCAWAIGGGVGLLLSLVLVRSGVLKRSFADEMPLLEVERDAAGQEAPTPAEWLRIKRLTRREMLRELAFLALPIMLGLLCAIWAAHGPGKTIWQALADNRAASAFCGSLLGGLIGGGVIWIVRVLGSLGFGREAMGLGDADLMFGIGCCLGAGPAGLALFPAAMIGLVFAVYRWLVRARHEMPFGPYLAIASLLMVVFWNRVYDFLAPSMPALEFLLGRAAPLFGF